MNKVVSTEFQGKALGTYWVSNKRHNKIFILRRAPIKKNGEEKRIRYLQHINNSHYILTEYESDEQWQEVPKPA